MKDASLENTIVSLHAMGWPVRRLAKEFKISRERVDRILRDNLHARETGEPYHPRAQKRCSRLDAYKEYIGELLEKYRDDPPTIERLLELIRERGYDGGRTILSDYLATVRGKKTP